MKITRRKVSITIAIVLLLSTLLYTEHSLARPLKKAASLIGVIDSERTIVGISDVRSTDHSRGNEKSDVMLIEYSDFGCLMCAAMQENFNKIIEEEGVRIISRHLYPYGGGVFFEQAVAAECVAKNAGEDAYFEFSQFLYKNQRNIRSEEENNTLTNKAISLGADARKYQECVENDEEIRTRIKNDSEEGWKLGARGTPYIVVVYKGVPVGISYANRYEEFLTRVKKLIANANNN